MHQLNRQGIMSETTLIVDDEQRIIDLAQTYLEQEGYIVSSATDGVTAYQQILDNPPGLVVLDLMLPGMDSLEVCRRVRTQSDVPIIMLTARSDDIDKIMGLELGADDYLTKLFNPRELGHGSKRFCGVAAATAARQTIVGLFVRCFVSGGMGSMPQTEKCPQYKTGKQYHHSEQCFPELRQLLATVFGFGVSHVMRNLFASQFGQPACAFAALLSPGRWPLSAMSRRWCPRQSRPSSSASCGLRSSPGWA